MMVRSAKDSTLRSSRPANLRCPRAARRSVRSRISIGEFAADAGKVASPEEKSQTGRWDNGVAARWASSRASYYHPTTNLAQLAVSFADALEGASGATCSPPRQDQLVAATFDLVTAGSYVDCLGCLSFFVDVEPDGPHFSLTVGEVGDEHYDDTNFAAVDLARELADAADVIEDQCAFALGPCVVVLSALPDFSDDAPDEEVDLTDFVEIIRPHANS